jgi:uncharacterized membrane protein
MAYGRQGYFYDAYPTYLLFISLVVIPLTIILLLCLYFLQFNPLSIFFVFAIQFVCLAHMWING